MGVVWSWAARRVGFYLLGRAWARALGLPAHSIATGSAGGSLLAVALISWPRRPPYEQWGAHPWLHVSTSPCSEIARFFCLFVCLGMACRFFFKVPW